MGQAVGGLRRIFNSWAGWRARWLDASVRATRDRHIAERTAALSARNDQLSRRIEELEAAKLQAEAASKAKSDFLASMSHELRTPLNAIIGFSEVLLERMFGELNPKQEEYLKDVLSSGRHLLSLINDIRDVVRHESGKMELKEDTVPVEDLIADALRLVTPQAREAKVHLNWRPAATVLPGLYCDRVRVRQILLNVLSNAVKFTEPGGSIDIKTEVTSGLELIVRDTGIGIRPEDIARILTPFGQVASVYSRNHQGAGLGLTLTKALIERHGGHLSLYSSPGLGTTVRLSFPADRLVERQAERNPAIGLGVVD